MACTEKCDAEGIAFKGAVVDGNNAGCVHKNDYSVRCVGERCRFVNNWDYTPGPHCLKIHANSHSDACSKGKIKVWVKRENEDAKEVRDGFYDYGDMVWTSCGDQPIS